MNKDPNYVAQQPVAEQGELLPCPFCGGVAAIQEHEAHTHSGPLKAMGIPDHPGSFTIECIGNPNCNTGQIADTREAVVAMWNRRAAIAASQQANRRGDIMPGKMRCAKCDFSLLRTTLNVATGSAYAGDSKTEPCPNGCGPLWPMTWEQEAREGYKLCDQIFERAQTAEAALAERAASQQAAEPVACTCNQGQCCPVCDPDVSSTAIQQPQDECALLNEQAATLLIQRKRIQKYERQLKEITGCFEAAEIEGLSNILNETTDERLKDLVERRLMHAYYATQQKQLDSPGDNC